MRALNRRFDKWLTAPMPDAAGRLGLYRIVYALLFLWYSSRVYRTELALRSRGAWAPPELFGWVPAPPQAAYGVLEPLLVALLVLLMLGLFTRATTIAVLAVSFTLILAEVSLTSPDRTLMLFMFYVPLFMVASPWGETYSLDAWIRRKRGLPTTDPANDSWLYAWPVRALLLLLSWLFLTAGWRKISQLDWVIYPEFVAYFIQKEAVRSQLLNGSPVNPLVPFVSQTPWVYIPAQYGVMAFEFLFFTVLFFPIARFVLMRALPLFHAANAILLGIPFPGVLPMYPAFMNLSAIYRPVERYIPRIPANTPLVVPIAVGFGLAALLGLTWNTTPIPRTIFDVGGLLTPWNMWKLIAAVAVVWYAYEAVRTLRRLSSPKLAANP